MKKIIKKFLNKILLKEFRSRFLELEKKIDLLINNQVTNSKFKNISGLPKDFDPSKYLVLNPDVAEAKVDPSEHFLMYGRFEDREYNDSNDLAKICAKYDVQKPEDVNAYNLFKGAWSTAFFDKNQQNISKGNFGAISDNRLFWLFEKFNVKNKRVLELGHLEGGHSVCLENNGADVIAIESNIGGFLRSLIVKNHYELKTKFLLGDFTKMVFDENEFDLVFASGVLYHMDDPIGFLKKISNYSKSLYLWTHYFEPDLKLWNPNLKSKLERGKWNYKEPQIENYEGLSVRTIKQNYQDALNLEGLFIGGPEEYSYWIMKDDLLKLLNKLGYKNIEIAFDEPGHQNGPCFCVFAQK